MPRLNLKEDSFEGDITQDSSEHNVNAPPSLRDVGGGGGISPVLLIIIILVVLAGGAFLLNHFGVIHLWGPKTTELAEMSESDLPPPDWASAEEGEASEAMPDPLLAPSTDVPPPEASTEVRPPVGAQQSQAPAVVPPRSTQPSLSTPPPSIGGAGSGNYTIQVSAWMTQQKADAEAAKLSAAGYTAFVEDAFVGGESWYRVRVGRYATEQEAQQAAAQLQPLMESQLWVSRVRR